MKTQLSSVLIVLSILCSSRVEAASGWKKASERDPLTGKTVTFIRGYSGAAEGLRNFEVLRVGEQFLFRFVVPQLGSPVVQHGRGYSVIKVPEELGDSLAWSVDGKAPHSVNPDLSRKKSDLINLADYQATWPVGCEEIRELAIGGILRVVTPNFNAEISLTGFNQYLEKVYGLTQKELISRSASICTPVSSGSPP